MLFRFLALQALCLFFTLPLVFAQQEDYLLSGKILNQQGSAVDAATVMLLRLSDSVLLKTTLTEIDGRYSFDHLEVGNYRVKAYAMGYNEQEGNVLRMDTLIKAHVVPDILLTATSHKLQEVAIVSKKPWVERKIDRTVVNVDALLSNAGTTALDVLEKSPGIMVQDGNISLKGKSGVMILIDDKPTYLEGKDLESYLRSLPAELLNQIEIMTQPPAQYDAAGNAGVINIKTKKSKIKGFNGIFNSGFSQGQLSGTFHSLNFNFRQDKMNVFANFSGGIRQSFQDLNIYRDYKNTEDELTARFNQNSYNKRINRMLRGKIGLDYYATEKTTLGIALSGNGWNNGSKETINSAQTFPSGLTDFLVEGLNKGKTRHRDGWINFNYRHRFREQQELTFDADYLVYQDRANNTFDNTFLQPDQTVRSRDLLTGTLPSIIHIYTAKADYTQRFREKWKFDAGLKTSYIKMDNVADYSLTMDQVTTPDYDKSNHFIYKEHINAGYLNLSREAGRWSFQAGLRLENTLSDGHQLGNTMRPDSVFRRSYTNLFPTLFLSYKLDTLGNNHLNLNYGRRIGRPYYEDMNPFLSPKDKFTYYVGNPFLKPAFTNSIELSHTYKNKVTTTISYSNSTDNVDETIEIRNGIYYSRPGNIGKKVVMSASVDAGFDLTTWLNVHLYTEVSDIHSKTNFYTGPLDTRGTYFFINPNVQLDLGRGWNAEVNGSYISSIYNVQFVTVAYWTANAGIQKKLSPAATLKLNLRDIFYTQVGSGTINNLAQTDASWSSVGDTRVATLTFSYRFGKAMTDSRKHDARGAESEQNRIK